MSASLCQTHHGRCELDLLMDVIGVELCVAKVFTDVEGKLPHLLRVHNAFFRTQIGDDALKDRHARGAQTRGGL